MRRFRNCLALFSLLMLPLCVQAAEQWVPGWLGENCPICAEKAAEKTGVYILEKGEEALLGRAWLTQNAVRSIDVQYFIWSSDNIGTLAAEQLLSAAERGVRVRVLVDDTLIDAQDKTLVLLSAHPNAHIRIYNPNLRVGVSFWKRVSNAFTNFRAVNQRMHDKTAIFDGVAGITGGRNMADEYFDFDHEYNFRDRDVLLLRPAVTEMSVNFEEFWNSEFAHPVENLLDEINRKLTAADVLEKSRALHAYAADPANFEPQIRQAIMDAPRKFPGIVDAMSWEDVSFISDNPGKNPGEEGLGGGGESTKRLIAAVENARSSILIQSPYLIMPEGGIDLFAALVRRGVRIRVSTNSSNSWKTTPDFNPDAAVGHFKRLRVWLNRALPLEPVL